MGQIGLVWPKFEEKGVLRVGVLRLCPRSRGNYPYIHGAILVLINKLIGIRLFLGLVVEVELAAA